MVKVYSSGESRREWVHLYSCRHDRCRDAKGRVEEPEVILHAFDEKPKRITPSEFLVFRSAWNTGTLRPMLQQ